MGLVLASRKGKSTCFTPFFFFYRPPLLPPKKTLFFRSRKNVFFFARERTYFFFKRSEHLFFFKVKQSKKSYLFFRSLAKERIFCYRYLF